MTPSRTSFRLSALAMLVAGLGSSGSALATNGMAMEAYGAKSAGMGGTGAAYDIGNSGVMTNPATLALRPAGNNFGLGLSVLMPRVNTEAGPMNASSSGDSYLMPSISYIRKDGRFTYGAAMLAQGGMGTEYGTGSFLSMGTGLETRSEVGFGRLMFPLAWEASDRFIIGGTVDFVWASMDMKGLFSDPTNPMAPPTYVDFSDGSDFSGAATGNGWAFKLGGLFKLNERVNLGAWYHSKTDIDDLTGNGQVGMLMGGGMAGGFTFMPAEYRVKDFQWPETWGLGMAWEVNDQITVAADYKRLNWSSSMENFVVGMTVMGQTQTMSMPQNWDDQNVFALGVQYKLNPQLALRAGANFADNPVPDATLNPLFPAIIKNSYSLGAGYRFDDSNSLSAAWTYAPEVDQTNSMTGMKNSHYQNVFRINYTYNF